MSECGFSSPKTTTFLVKLSLLILLFLSPRWLPPATRTLKLNVDVVTNKQFGFICVGVVVRNHVGQVLGEAALRITGCFSAHLAGRSFALQYGF
ncbi:hypothetical protein TorRG33x02_007760 [Trema orientale]|uniref:RNase H type-1 domain-containing protein n=1 Tax=Trema orientale TaxID=63057 RepID=A0A2P5G0L7_TREOI|nr:hypothetical protein TorRG33x02_007760 [Trema orientale]